GSTGVIVGILARHDPQQFGVAGRSGRFAAPLISGPARRAPESPPPRSCRAIALERAKSSAVLSAATARGEIRPEKSGSWAADGTLRRGRAGLPGRVPYPVRGKVPGKPLSPRDNSGRRRRGGKPPHGQRGRGWVAGAGRGERQNRRLAVRASRHRGPASGGT